MMFQGVENKFLNNQITPLDNRDAVLCFNPIPASQLAGFLVKETHGLVLQGSSAFDELYEIDKKFTGPGILKVQCSSATNAMDVSAGFDLYLVDN